MKTTKNSKATKSNSDNALNLLKIDGGWIRGVIRGGRAEFYTSPSATLIAAMDADGMYVLRRNNGVRVIYREACAETFCRKALRAEARFAKAQERHTRIAFAEPFVMVSVATSALMTARAAKPQRSADIEMLAALVSTTLRNTPGGMEVFARALLTAESDVCGLHGDGGAVRMLAAAFAKR